MTYTTFLFDWDGTLLDSAPIWFEILDTVFGHVGVTLTPQQKKRVFNRWDNALDDGIITPKQWDEMLAFAGPIMDERIRNIPLIDGVENVLQELHKRGCKTALITRSPKSVLGNMLEAHGLIGAFDATIAFEDAAEHKPHPAPLLKAMEELGADPEETLMVGDSETDLIAAKRAGIDRFLFFQKGNEAMYDKSDLLKLEPTKVFTSWDEFLKLVE